MPAKGGSVNLSNLKVSSILGSAGLSGNARAKKKASVPLTDAALQELDSHPGKQFSSSRGGSGSRGAGVSEKRIPRTRRAPSLFDVGRPSLAQGSSEGGQFGGSSLSDTEDEQDREELMLSSLAATIGQQAAVTTATPAPAAITGTPSSEVPCFTTVGGVPTAAGVSMASAGAKGNRNGGGAGGAQSCTCGGHAHPASDHNHVHHHPGYIDGGQHSDNGGPGSETTAHAGEARDPSRSAYSTAALIMAGEGGYSHAGAFSGSGGEVGGDMIGGYLTAEDAGMPESVVDIGGGTGGGGGGGYLPAPSTMVNACAMYPGEGGDGGVDVYGNGSGGFHHDGHHYQHQHQHQHHQQQNHGHGHGHGHGQGEGQGQGQALHLASPPLAPLDRNRFKAEAMELEAALRSRGDGGVHGRADEGDASGQQLASARRLRSLLSSNREELIREALDRDWVPLLMGWLGADTRPAVQVEALWALTNIAAGASDQAQVLTNSGAVPPLVVLLDSPNEEVLEQALWLLGNLAGEDHTARDAVLAVDALPPLVRCLERHQGLRSLLKIGSWTLSNLCDGHPRPVLDVQVVIPALAKLLQHSDSEILSHTCWALSHLCDGPSTHIRAVVDADICWRLVELLTHRSWRVTKPALRTIGNIVCAEDDTDYTQHIIDAGAVPCLQQLIAHSNREIQKEACWTLSNIAAGTVEQIQTVLDSGALPSLVRLASSKSSDPADPDGGGADPEVRSEASWAVLNATSCGSDHQIEYLVQEGGIKVLGELLKKSSMVMMALEGLERILQVGDKEAHRLMMGESSGLQQGNIPQQHQHQHQHQSVQHLQQQHEQRLMIEQHLKRDPGQLQQQQPRGNPYAALLQATKIELLETHKNTAVAKRAQRIRKNYFVRCAICQQSFSKASLNTRFCSECKCDVCRDCDCNRFHLEFQEELWKEMSEQEASAKASKKNKKLKKKQKAKERNKAISGGAAGGANGSATVTAGTLTAQDTPPPPPPLSNEQSLGVEDASVHIATAPATKVGASEGNLANGVPKKSSTHGRDGGKNGSGKNSSSNKRGQPTKGAPAAESSSSFLSSSRKQASRSGGSPGEKMQRQSVAHGEDGGAPIIANGRRALGGKSGGRTENGSEGVEGSWSGAPQTKPSKGPNTAVSSESCDARGATGNATAAGTTAVANTPPDGEEGLSSGSATARRHRQASQANAVATPTTGDPSAGTSIVVGDRSAGGTGGHKGKGQRRSRASADKASTASVADSGLPGASTYMRSAAGVGGDKSKRAPGTPVEESTGVASGLANGSGAVAGERGGVLMREERSRRAASGGVSKNVDQRDGVTKKTIVRGAAEVVGSSDTRTGSVPVLGGFMSNGKGRNGSGSGPRVAGKTLTSSATGRVSSLSSVGGGGNVTKNGPMVRGGGKRAGGGDDESLRQNDNYVSFLNQTGSILALAQMLDKQSLEDP